MPNIDIADRLRMTQRWVAAVGRALRRARHSNPNQIRRPRRRNEWTSLCSFLSRKAFLLSVYDFRQTLAKQ
jgi:hypothetical protein